MTNKTTAWYASRYIKNFGLAIVPIEPNRKYPRAKDWGHRVITDPEMAEAFYTNNPDHNLGVALHPSRMCSLDIDCMESFAIICEAFGVNLDELIAQTPTIQGRAPNMRLEFRVPADVDLPYVKLNWRPEADPKGEKYHDLLAQAREAKAEGNKELEAEIRENARQYAPYTVFELRSATDGSQKQDVYPPSIHPDTGQPYKWITQPAKNWPEPPQWLLTIWREFDKIKPQLLAACPWADVDEIYKPAPAKKPQYAGSGGGLVAISDKFNREHDIVATLVNYGYTQIGKRLLSPSSHTKLPGVVIFEHSNKAWIHHASDPLCSDESKQPVSPFDLYCYFEHNNDFKRATLSLADRYGYRRDTPVQQPVIDSETGEVLNADNTSPVGACDYLAPLPWSHKGKPYKHPENLAEILRRLNVTVRYNVVRKEEEILIPGVRFSLDNTANASMAWLIGQCSLFNFSTDSLQEFITLLADANQYSPVTTWIDSKPWDGKSRLADLCNTITVSPGFSPELKDTLIRKWLISAVAAAYSKNGISVRGVLIFQGDQGIGKTHWFKQLAPEHLDVIQDGVILRPDDKDSVKHAVSHWLVELGELDATFKRSDIAQLKAFITRDRDSLRMPYARKESRFARRTVFFGSVNPKEFLNDPTGNTRFWTIPCAAINHNHGIDMQQLWAEIKAEYLGKETYHLTELEAEQLNTSNDDYMAIDPVEERIMESLNWDSAPTSWDWIQATDALLRCGMDRPTRSDTLKAAQVIRRLNGEQSKKGSKGKRLLLVPQRKQNERTEWDYFD